MKRSFGDFIICAAVVLAAALLLVIPGLFKTVFSSAVAQVTVDGDVVAELPLGSDTVYDVGNGVIVSVSNGCVSIIDSDCKDKLCVSLGERDKNGQCSVCLPNKTAVTVYSKANGEVDGIV